jgi:hypothetical protein
MENRLSLFAFALALNAVGCASEVQDESDAVGVDVEGLYSGGGTLPQGSPVAQRSATCLSNEVMTGFCGRVDNNSKFTQV